VRTGGDDRSEARCRGATQPHVVLEHQRQLALGAALDATLEQRLQSVVGDPRGRGDELDLVLVLDQAHVLDESLHGNQFGTFRERLARALERVDGRALGLVADVERALRQVLEDLGDQVLCDGDPIELRYDLLVGLLGVAEVGQEDARVRTDQGETVGACVARQVADVDEIRHHHQVDAGPVKLAISRFSARAHATSSSLSRWSASR